MRQRLAVLMRLVKYMEPYMRTAIGVAVLVIVTGALYVVPPYVIGWIVDHVVEAGQWELLGRAVGLLVIIAVLLGGLGFLLRYQTMLVANQVIYDLRNQLFAHLQRQSMRFYQHMKTGELMSRLTADVQTLEEFFGFGLRIMISFVVQILLGFAILFTLDWQLALISLALLPFLTHALARYSGRIRPMYTRIQERTAELTEVLRENIAGVRVVQVFANEPLQQAHLEPVHRSYYDAHLDAARLTAFYQPYMKFLSQMSVAVVLLIGGLKVVAGTMSLGDFVAFNAYLFLLTGPIEFISWIVNITAMAVAAGQRIFEVLDAEPVVRDAPGARPLGQTAGEVLYEDVWFAYRDDEPPVLEEINLHVEPGMRLAILGTSGSGKTTLTQLLPRFYDPTRGRILLDGRDLRQLSLRSLRRRIGVVHQETFLFNVTIRENIAYGRPGAGQAEAERAARTANIHDFIQSLPDGYDTLVGERGVRLSGGQKQRLAIARALLLDPPILILDESTSSVDARTERLINEAMQTVMAGRTSLVIAHRLSTVRTAHRVIIMRGGRIVEAGTHEELAQSGELYRLLQQLQERERRLAAEDEQLMAGGEGS